MPSLLDDAAILSQSRGSRAKLFIQPKQIERVPHMKKLAVMAAVAAAMSVNVQAFDVAAKYQQSCGICHAAAVAGAPKSFDKAAWEPRLAKGMDALVASVTNGLNAMPPRG